MAQEKVIATRPTKTIYRSGDKLIKRFVKGYSKWDVLNEALNQSRVEETGLHIPHILEVNTIDGQWAIVMDFIEGKTLDTLMAESPEKKDEYLALFVDIQLEMHTKTAPLLNKLWDKMARKIDETDLPPSTRYELHARLGGLPKYIRLCHGDYNPSNIIVGEDGKYYIIDWSHATQGNASADAARTYLLFKLAGEDDMAEKYLTLFCEKSGTERPAVTRWLSIVAASQSVKGKPEEREFLMHWVDVVDFE